MAAPQLPDIVCPDCSDHHLQDEAGLQNFFVTRGLLEVLFACLCLTVAVGSEKSITHHI